MDEQGIDTGASLFKDDAFVPGEGREPGMDEASVSSLGSFAMRLYRENASHRRSSGVDDELRECLYAANSRYLPEVLSTLKAVGIEPVYFPYTATKVQAAIAWISEIFLNSTDKPYSIRATPLPELPASDVAFAADELVKAWVEDFGRAPRSQDEVISFIFYAERRKSEYLNRLDEEARRKAANMERLIDDQFTEGGWKRAMGDVVRDISTFGTGILRGPDFRMRKRVRHVSDPASGETTCTLEWRPVAEWRHIDPFDVYPSPGAVDIQDGALCIRMRILPRELSAMRGFAGYRAEAIDSILTRYPNGGLLLDSPNDTEVRVQRGDGGDLGRSVFLEGVEVWAECRGADLFENGVTEDLGGEPLLMDAYYEAHLIVMDGEVVYASLTDERLGRPFYKGTFYCLSGSWWGQGPARIMRDLQKEMNAAKRNLAFNMAMASGPVRVITDINAIQNPDSVRSIMPWQTIVCKRTAYGVPGARAPVEFLQTPMVARELMDVLELAQKHADTVTGIPAYSHGSQMAAGGGRTASGLAMLMDAAQRGAKHVIFSLDRDVMRPCVEYLYRFNLLTSEDASVKGDCEVDAGGLLSIISRDKNLSLIKELLVVLADPNKASVIGEEGMAALLREYVRQAMYVNPDDIIPSKEALAARRRMREEQAALEQAQMAQMAPQGAEGARSGGAAGMPRLP